MNYLETETVKTVEAASKALRNGNEQEARRLVRYAASLGVDSESNLWLLAGGR